MNFSIKKHHFISCCMNSSHSNQLVFNGKYKTNRNNLLGTGSYGNVYLVKEIHSKKK